MPSLTGVPHVALTVTDVDRSVPWYERVLGFDTVERADGEFGVRMVTLRGPGLGVTLTLVQHPDCGGAAFDQRRPGLDHLTFAVPSRDCLREWTDRLTECGVTFVDTADEPIGGGAVAAAVCHQTRTGTISLRDPDGIQLVLRLDEPGSPG